MLLLLLILDKQIIYPKLIKRIFLGSIYGILSGGMIFLLVSGPDQKTNIIIGYSFVIFFFLRLFPEFIGCLPYSSWIEACPEYLMIRWCYINRKYDWNSLGLVVPTKCGWRSSSIRFYIYELIPAIFDYTDIDNLMKTYQENRYEDRN